MDVERIQEYCLAKPGAWADNPWDHEHPVIKVGEGERGTIFAFLGSGGVGLKCGPSRDAAGDWLEHYPDHVRVMAYIGRSGWNDLLFGGAIPDDELLEAVDESYRLVVSGLPAKHRPDGWESAVAASADEPGQDADPAPTTDDESADEVPEGQASADGEPEDDDPEDGDEPHGEPES